MSKNSKHAYQFGTQLYVQTRAIEDLLMEINVTVRGPVIQHFVIAGMRGMGKTTALLYLHRRLDEEPDIYSIFVSGNLVNNHKQFFQTLLTCALEVYSDKVGLVYSNKVVLGEYEEAERLFRKAIKLSPKDAEARTNLGVTLAKLGRLEEAERAFKQAIKLNPNHADAHYNLGVTLAKLGRLEEAERAFKQAIKLNPNHADAHNSIGVTLAKLGRLEEAERAFKQAIKLNPNHVIAYNSLGLTLDKLGRREEAERSFRKALELNPNDAAALGKMRSHIRSWRMEAEYCWSIIRATAEKGNMKTVVFVDDFDLLLQNLGEGFSSYLRSNLSDNPYLTLVASATSTEFLSNIEKPFLKFFKVRLLETFSENHIQKTLEDSLSISGFELKNEAIRKIIQATNGIPLYVLLLFKELIYQAVMTGNRIIKEKDVERTLPLTIENLNYYFSTSFDQIAPTQRDILLTMTNGEISPKKIEERTGLPSGSITPNLIRLMDRKYIEKVGRGKYRIKDMLFRTWLRGKHKKARIEGQHNTASTT